MAENEYQLSEAVREGTHMGWEKGMNQSKRRRKALRAHKGDELAAARSLQALANLSQDKATKEAAASDAAYFYREHRKRQRVSSRTPHITQHVGRLK